MPLALGTVVQSLSGHDAGGFFVVVGEEKGFLLLADGKRRPLTRPKRKNPAHVRKTNQTAELSAVRSDKHLRRILAVCRQHEGGNVLV